MIQFQWSYISLTTPYLINHHTIKSRGRVQQLRIFLSSVLEVSQLSASHLSPFYPGREIATDTERTGNWVGPVSVWTWWRRERFLTLSGVGSTMVQIPNQPLHYVRYPGCYNKLHHVQGLVLSLVSSNSKNQFRISFHLFCGLLFLMPSGGYR
jgi:hypothetical protein